MLTILFTDTGTATGRKLLVTNVALDSVLTKNLFPLATVAKVTISCSH